MIFLTAHYSKIVIIFCIFFKMYLFHIRSSVFAKVLNQGHKTLFICSVMERLLDKLSQQFNDEKSTDAGSIYVVLATSVTMTKSMKQ